MFKFNGFTVKANNALNYAILISEQLGHTYVGSEHILLGLMREGSGIANTMLSQKGLNYDNYSKSVIQHVGRGVISILSPADFTKNAKRIIENCSSESRKLGLLLADTEHILLAICTQPNSSASKYLATHGFMYSDVLTMLDDIITSSSYPDRRVSQTPPQRVRSTPTRTGILYKFGRDLTELAYGGRLDPVIGRSKEIERVIQILTRRTKNNPCLIGETGVGKTAIVEGLAQYINNGTVPKSLLDKRVITIDLTSMVSGTKYRGDFEERIRNMIDEVITAGNIILFIDEIHTIMGVGAAEGAVDAANMMKPQLARGGFQVIGATTTEEYRKTIERDSALERRFQKILVEEPCEEDSLAILRGLRPKYELHHQITISDEALLAAISLSQRYDCGRFLPDKAIDLLDEAASRLRMYSTGKTKNELVLTKEHIAKMVAQTTGIELCAITEEETQRYLTLDTVLSKQVIGQTEAIKSICKALRRSRVGLKDPIRPIASFMFAGTTGVGKTHLCRVLAETLFGSRDSIIKLDMSEYMEKHTVSRLIGSPPGYVGFEEGGQLTDKIRRKPYSIVLFDEIEKAHPDVANILLQILEDGEVTDAMGRKAVFKNAIIILTTNIGSQYFGGTSVGFAADEESAVQQKSKIVSERIKEHFRPELLNRLDDVVVFHPLSDENLQEIAVLEIDKVKLRLKLLDISMEYDITVPRALVGMDVDKKYGARPLRRVAGTHIEDRIADGILTGTIKSGDSIHCSFLDGELKILSNLTQFV